jgi:hypothetical protein
VGICLVAVLRSISHYSRPAYVCERGCFCGAGHAAQEPDLDGGCGGRIDRDFDGYLRRGNVYPFAGGPVLAYYGVRIYRGLCGVQLGPVRGEEISVRILFTFAGGSGHLNPLIPIARAAESAGHTAAFVGRPWMVPRGADQPFNAARCADLGLAQVLDAVEATPESVRTAAAALPDLEYAMRLLERLAVEKQPLPA